MIYKCLCKKLVLHEEFFNQIKKSDADFLIVIEKSTVYTDMIALWLQSDNLSHVGANCYDWVFAIKTFWTKFKIFFT